AGVSSAVSGHCSATKRSFRLRNQMGERSRLWTGTDSESAPVLALTMIRLRRSARLEAEYITHLLNPPIYGEAQEPLRMPLFERPLIDPGLPAPVDSWKFDPVVKTFQRYDTALENKLFRAMHEVERLRRMRLGEQLPAPV